ncbi:MAG: DeoR/GlpR transcriptional regulator [Ruminiclostridium sp.]|nr:DeoR/GlpR transcriptional regulator [Ruminiclostridium sp.]
MLTEERHSMIIKAVNERSSVTIAELAEILDVSASTVKRDLIILANEGKIIKVRGGAMSKNESFTSVEKNVEEKASICTEEKMTIAKYAAELIEKGDFIFLDAGTTTEKIIDYLNVRDVTFVTNGFIHAKKLARKGYKVFITGGEIKASTEAIVGAECVLTLKNYNFTKCFMGTNGISLTAGFTTPDVNEAKVKSAAIESSREVYVLADHSKFDEISSATFAGLGKAVIITDKIPNRKYKDVADITEV